MIAGEPKLSTAVNFCSGRELLRAFVGLVVMVDEEPRGVEVLAVSRCCFGTRHGEDLQEIGSVNRRGQ